MFDPTQTQPLSWRMHQGKPIPADEIPEESTTRRAPTFDDDAPPDRLSDYRLRARLGGGRLGPIYEAQDELSRISGSQHYVAIQLIDDRIASRPGFANDFERGAAELKSISHPNIVRLLEYGEERNRFYLVNEMLESASLRFVLSDAGSLPSAETTAVLRAVGDALQYLHAKGMVHGNLRPENVLVTFGYEVKVLDVVPNGWIVNPNDALGVPARAPDKRDDVFGLACLAYEMLSGRHPYNGNTAQEAYRSGLEPERLENVTDRQWRALSGALAVHRDDRTPNVQQFLDDLGVRTSQKLKSVVATPNAPVPVADEPIPLPTYTAPDPPPAFPRAVYAKRASRGAHERRGVFGKLVVLLLVLGLGYAAWYYQDSIRTFSSDLMTEVETRIAAEQAPSTRSPAPPTSTGAPLETAPTVTDPEPATVLAPGANVPESATAREPAPGERAAAPRTEPPPAPRREVPATPERQASAMPRRESTAPERREAAPAQTRATPPPIVEREPAPAQEAPVEAAPVEEAPAPAPAVAAGPTRFLFQQGVVTVREGDVAARITIRRSGDLSGSATVSWWTAQGTARADADYADLGARIERFEPGEASRTIYVPLTNDSVREPPKNFRVLLGRGEGGEAASETRVDLIDDD
jgi:hypothetical protein